LSSHLDSVELKIEFLVANLAVSARLGSV